MHFDDLLQTISDSMPPFNDWALRGFVRHHIDNSPAFPAMVLREGFRVVGDDLQLVGEPEVLSPEETVRYELIDNPRKVGPIKIPLTVSHMQLVRYKVRFLDKYLTIHLYMPYMIDDMLKIRDKYSMIRKVVLEQTFSRVTEKDRDGISLSPIRVNLMFNRRNTYKIYSYVSKQFYDHFLITAKLFHGKIPAKMKWFQTTLVHYMLAKFGFINTLHKFGLSEKDIMFVKSVDTDTNQFDYFAAVPFDDKSESGPDFFLKVRRTILADDQSKKFVVNLLYTLNAFRLQTLENVYAEDGLVWRIMLGVALFPDPPGPKAASNAESHINSVDTFIDPITRDRLRHYNVMISDIYELLVYVFGEIDNFMVNNQVQDLYSSRIDVTNGLLVQSYGVRMTRSIYPLGNRSNILERDVKQALGFNSMMFRTTSSSRLDEDRDYLAPPSIIGDNFLLAGGLNKIRMGGKAEQRFHASMAVGESVDAFVGKTIGRTGYLNPYIPVDERGTILHPDYAAEIDQIDQFLPR